MSIIEMYYYLFYKFYKLFKAITFTRSLYDMKAVIVVMSLELWIILSLYNYYAVLSNQYGQFEILSFKILVPCIIIIIIKWFAFWRNDDWKGYVNKFDQWPKERNIQGTWIVVAIVLFVSANLAFSFYLNPPSNGWR
jgi:purine-cytosine permease-like protein